MPSSLTRGLAWKGALWVVLPALASAPALALEPKWQLLYVAAMFGAVPIALTVRDARPWLFLAGALSAFNFTKVLGGRAASPTADSLAIAAIDLPIVMLLAMGFVSATSAGASRVRLAPSVRRVLIAGLVFVGWVAFSAVGRRPDASLSPALAYGRMFIALAVVGACAVHPGRMRWVTWGLFVALFAQSAIAAAQYVTHSSLGWYEQFEAHTATGTFTRSGGTLNPTVLSEFIGVVAPIALASAFAVRRHAAAALLLTVFGAAASASLMTLSRAGLASLVLTTLIVFAAALPNPAVPRPRKVILALGLPVFAIGVMALFSDAMLARIAQLGIEAQGNEARGVQLVQAQRMILSNPLFGVGPGNYVAVMGEYGPTLPYPVHNKFLLIAAECGAPAALLYLGIWMFTLSAVVRTAARTAGGERLFQVAVAAALVATLLNMNTDVYGAGGAPELALFLVAGLGLGSGGRQPERARREVPEWEMSCNPSAPAR